MIAKNVQKLSSKGWGNFIARSKSWTNIKPINNEYINLPSVYEQVEKCKTNSNKTFGKPIISTHKLYFLINGIDSQKVS